MIAIIDYGIGNIASIQNMLKKIGCKEVIVAQCAHDLLKADKFILPGVGAFDMGMCLLNKSGMREELDRQVLTLHKPILGICLGMQMLGERSEEGNENGLGYIPFSCKRFDFNDKALKVPHMGWDYISVEKSTALATDFLESTRFYFVHSYYAECDNIKDVMFQCYYGIQFAAGVNRDNIYGVQFHPEKSHKYGKLLLKNFVEGV